MKTSSDQTETLLLELERRARVLQDCSEKLETQLKVMLVQQSCGNFPPELVARIANALAVCLSGRGDKEQAGQYAQMAANLIRRQGGARQPGGGTAVSREESETGVASFTRRSRMESTRPGQGCLPRRYPAFIAWWGAWWA